MPQLCPTPWLSFLVYTWLVILILVLVKTLVYLFPNGPLPHTPETLKTQPWYWPWC